MERIIGNTKDGADYVHPRVMGVLNDVCFIESVLSDKNKKMFANYLDNELKKGKLLEDRCDMLIDEVCVKEQKCLVETLQDDESYITSVGGNTEEIRIRLEDILQQTESVLKDYAGADLCVGDVQIDVLKKSKSLYLFGILQGAALGFSALAGIHFVFDGSPALFFGSLLLWAAGYGFGKVAKFNDNSYGRYCSVTKQIEVKCEIDIFHCMNMAVDSIIAHELGHAIFRSNIPLRDRRNKERFSAKSGALDEGFALYVENVYNLQRRRQGNKLYFFPWFNLHTNIINRARESIDMNANDVLESVDTTSSYGRAASLGYVACCFVDRQLKFSGTNLLSEICASNYYPLINLVNRGRPKKKVKRTKEDAFGHRSG